MKLAETTDPSQHPEERARRHYRFRRAKQILRPLPRRATLHRYPFIKWFAATARKKPYLWSFRVAQVSPAFYAGCMLAFLPAVGVQIPLAFLAAIIFRANLLVTVAMQFWTNIVTMVPIYIFTRHVGHKIIGWFGLGEMDSHIGANAYAFVVGGLVVGFAVALVLDTIYRIAAHHTARHPLNVRRMLKR